VIDEASGTGVAGSEAGVEGLGSYCLGTITHTGFTTR
jgi:hypothetical protein